MGWVPLPSAGVSPERALLHLVAASDVNPASLVADLPTKVTALVRDRTCFMAGRSPQSAAVETVGGSSAVLVDIARSLRGAIDPDRSMAIIGTDRVFIAPPSPAPVRYQYLMHRRDDLTHDAYLERYETIHSWFGLRTPNIEGYVQLHVDPAASIGLGAATGLTAAPCDSMSELHLRSVEHFIEGVIAHPELGREAQEDEERFVDRAASFGFAHRVV